MEDFALIGLNEECHVVVLEKLTPKLKDPWSFSIPYPIGNLLFDKTLCDLGVSINLMPYFVFKKLGLQELLPTKVYLQLVCS